MESPIAHPGIFPDAMENCSAFLFCREKYIPIHTIPRRYNAMMHRSMTGT